MLTFLVMLYISHGAVQIEAWQVPGDLEKCWELLPRVAQHGILVPEWATFTCIELQREPGRGST